MEGSRRYSVVAVPRLPVCTGDGYWSIKALKSTYLWVVGHDDGRMKEKTVACGFDLTT